MKTPMQEAIEKVNAYQKERRHVEIVHYTVTEGPHAGHDVMTDAFAVDFLRADPAKSFYCRTCKAPVTGAIA